MDNRFIGYIKRLVYFLRKKIDNIALFFVLCLKRKNKLYRFSIADVYLYISELNWNLPSLINYKREEEFFLLGIEDKKFYWPKNIKTDDLPWVYNEIFMNRLKNPSTYDHKEACLEGASWCIDCGAFEGFFSVFASTKGCKDIVLVEPIEKMKAALEKTFQEFYPGVSARVETVGVGSSKSKILFNYDQEHLCASSVGDKGGEEIDVETIDNIVDKYSFTGQGFIKMDIEGQEMNALIGAKQTLRTLKPRLAIAVYHDYDNAVLCKKIIEETNPSYKVVFRGMYNYFQPARPYLLYAY